MNSSCRLCGANALATLLSLGCHPIAHRFLDAPDQKEYTHDVTLLFCGRCGFIQINDPVPPEELYTHYNWLSSWKPQPHIPRLLDLIQSKTTLQPSAKILEIGCNDGTFLAALGSRGFNNLVGIEPAQDAESAAKAKGLRTFNTYFGPNMANELLNSDGPFDLFVARQVLEHISGLSDMAGAISRVLAPGGYALIEVPDFGFCLDRLDYTAIWEEHVNYFTLETLTRFFSQAGLKLLHSEVALFSGQALIAIAQKDPSVKDTNEICSPESLAKIRRFGERWKSFPSDFTDYLKRIRNAGGQIAVYGAGCRASGLINFAGLAPYIDLFLDDQPEKQGRYMPGSRKPIFSGSELEKRPIKLCLLAVNAENEEKVLKKHNGFTGTFASIHPPSPLVPSFWSGN